MSAAPAARRIGRLDPAALAGVMTRDIVLFQRYWKSTTFSSIVQPTIYLLAFGLGFGKLVTSVGYVKYVDYVATGVVATAVLFSSAFPGMFNTFIRWQFQRTYDALLAAPVDVEELVTSAVLTPMFLVAGTFFPISTLPRVLRTIAQFNPLYHCVALVRDVSLQTIGSADLLHTAVLLAWALLMWRLAVWRLEARLIDSDLRRARPCRVGRHGPTRADGWTNATTGSHPERSTACSDGGVSACIAAPDGRGRRRP